MRMITRGLTLLLLAFAAAFCCPLWGQTGGEAGIQGTVTDPTGAAIGKATVTVTNTGTGVAITRQTSGDGLYTVSPILPGIYSVKVTAAGFEGYQQNNLRADALVLTPLNVTMKIGDVGVEVTVNEAPPQLESSNATLGLTIENESYANLPLALNGAQRDPTAFASLAPGSQVGARLPIIGGTGNYLGQLYLDGLPAETINQQGDNRLVSQAVSVDAVDQIQVVTSTPPAEYSGAGAANFTVKSGTLKYHGQVSDFIRNTAFDVAGFTSKQSFFKNAAGANQLVGVPIDHQNEFSASVGGHVPFNRRIFFFFAYDRYHNRTVAVPASFTIATPLMRAGDFTEFNCPAGAAGCVGSGLQGNAGNPAFIFDPTTTACVGATCTRQPFMGLKNGVPTNNVIPAGYLSPFAKAAQAFLPAPTDSTTLTNNYTAGLAGGFDNHLYDYRVDFDISPKHRLSTIGALGTVIYLNNFGTPFLPLPYTGGDLAQIYPKNLAVEDAYTISNRAVNQFKFGFTRFFQNIQNSTLGVPQYGIGTLGATNLPPGQAAGEFPGISFGANTAGVGGTAGAGVQSALTTYTTNSNATATQITTPNSFTLVDNLQYSLGKHSLTAGITVEWEQINNANPATYTGILSLSFNPADTAQFNGSTLNPAGTSGSSYASYLLGAVGGTPTLGLQPVAELGGRYRPTAPYLEDTWKATRKLTVDAGIRWDYFPPYHEVKDRWTFLNPSLMNAATGSLGAIQFAGNYGGTGVSCGCRTPVSTYFNNYGPRVGLTYAATEKTLLRAGIGRVFSQGGGVGGRAGAFQGTGQLGFNVTATGPTEVLTTAAAAPSFYLNNGPTFTSLGLANTSLFGPGYAYPTAPTPGPASQVLNTGNYINPATGKVVPAGAVSFADPYFSGRAPDFTFFNVGVEQAFTPTLVMSLNYVGNQSHHLYNSTVGGGNIRGYWSNQLNPIYLAGLGGLTDSGGKNPLLTSAATSANVAKAQSAMAGLNIPASFQAAAAVNPSATIAQGLVAFPQYSGVTDTWGVNSANFSYHSLQVTFQQREYHGLTYNVNYTWSRNIGDDGTFRSGFDIPGAAISGGGPNWHQDRIERGATTGNIPHNVHAFGVFQLPFGKGSMGGQNLISRTLLGGWQVSGIYSYTSGTPVAVITTGCSAPLQGQCMPDINPAFNSASARINGSYGTNADGSRTSCALGVGLPGVCGAVKVRPYFDANGFKAPNLANAGTGVAPITLLGNAPRTHALQLNNPGAQNLDTSIRKTIKLRESLNVQIEGDCFNTFNHTIFNGPNTTASSAAFGTITSVRNQPRQFELAAHFNF